jgi:hypothetical protein
MFFKKGRGALWVCIWNQGGGGPKKFGNHWSRSAVRKIQSFKFCNASSDLISETRNQKVWHLTHSYKNVQLHVVLRTVQHSYTLSYRHYNTVTRCLIDSTTQLHVVLPTVQHSYVVLPTVQHSYTFSYRQYNTITRCLTDSTTQLHVVLPTVQHSYT